jgi:hypothetical protein
MSEVLRQEISDLREQVVFLNQQVDLSNRALDCSAQMITHLTRTYRVHAHLVERNKIVPTDTEIAEICSAHIEHARNHTRYMLLQAELASLQRKYNEEV